MTYQNLDRQAQTARQRLVEASGTPFAPSPEIRPVVAVIDGRKRNDEIDPAAWRRALEAGDGSVAVYFELAGDHEWWLAYDDDREYGEYEGPFHQWSRYPTGPWDHSAVTGGMLEMNLENVYGVSDRDRECAVYRSRVVRLEDAPEFVRREVSDRD
ncbi:hypothetical protein [Natrinema pallidum]|uniref:hypothetical protein n=1 Tax=Natrinema pallidum TaxID=69527 RepID=UPI0015866118|nr:hypothetical protein [Natrinema pallidum]